MSKEVNITLLDKLKGTMTVSASKEKVEVIRKFLIDNKLSFSNISEFFFYLLDIAIKGNTSRYTEEQVAALEEQARESIHLEDKVKQLEQTVLQSQHELSQVILASEQLKASLEASKGVNLKTIINYPLVRDFVMSEIRKGASNDQLEVSDQDIVLVIINAYAKDIN